MNVVRGIPFTFSLLKGSPSSPLIKSLETSRGLIIQEKRIVQVTVPVWLVYLGRLVRVHRPKQDDPERVQTLEAKQKK